MTTWRRRLRLRVIAVASFVLLVTVLPQVASGIGLGSAGRPTGRLGMWEWRRQLGRLQQFVLLRQFRKLRRQLVDVWHRDRRRRRHGDRHRRPQELRVLPTPGPGACPDTGPTGQFCADPIYALSTDGSTYSLNLTSGTWRLDGFYEINAYRGAFLGPAQVVTVTADQPLDVDLSVPYARPAALSGRVQVTGVPSGITVEQTSVLLCPPNAPVQSHCLRQRLRRIPSRAAVGSVPDHRSAAGHLDRLSLRPHRVRLCHRYTGRPVRDPDALTRTL